MAWATLVCAPPAAFSASTDPGYLSQLPPPQPAYQTYAQPAAYAPSAADPYRLRSAGSDPARAYEQYLVRWHDQPPTLQSVYATAPAGWSAPAQPLPPLPVVQVASAPSARPLPAVPPTQLVSTQIAPTQIAQTTPASAPPPADDGLRYGRGDYMWVSELRFGILAHNKGPIASHTESGAQVNLEARFRSPDFMKIIFEPRPTVGASINTAGDTSYLYAGLTWGGFLFKTGFFVEGFFGMAVHDGWLDSHDPDPPRRLMGSRVVFREALEFGYRFWDVHSVSFMIDHYSNAGWIAERNQGNDDLGLRYGYKF